MLYDDDQLTEVSDAELRERRRAASERVSRHRAKAREHSIKLAQAEMDSEACMREVFRRLSSRKDPLTTGEKISLRSVTRK
jgi:hypothetical protein